LVLEIDITHESSRKFPIYAALGVPEIWRCDGIQLVLVSQRWARFTETR
jgi:Uma2 family endonuclease